MYREKVRGGDGVDMSLEFSEDRFQPPRTIKPPMAKELRVERRDDDAGPAGGLVMVPKRLDDQGCEMVRMGVGSLLRSVRVVGDLLPQREAPVRDAPVPQAVHPMLAMEFQVGAVPGISVVRTPDLDAGSRVPRQDRDFPPTGRGESVWLMGRKARPFASGIETTLVETVFVCADGRPPSDSVRVDEKVPELVAARQLFQN